MRWSPMCPFPNMPTSSALSPSPDLRPAGDLARSFDASRLGRARRLAFAAPSRAPPETHRVLGKNFRRRDEGPRTGGAPRRASSGLTRGMIGHGAAPIRRSPSMSMRKNANPSSRSLILQASRASSRSMVTLGIWRWCRRTACRSPSVGRTFVGAFTNSQQRGSLRSPACRSSGSARSIPLKAKSAVKIPMSVMARARKNAAWSSRNLNPGCARNSRSSAKRRNLPKRSAMPCHAGTV